MQGSLADKAKLVSRPGDTFRQDLSDRSRVDLISTLPLVPPPALCTCSVSHQSIHAAAAASAIAAVAAANAIAAVAAAVVAVAADAAVAAAVVIPA